MIINRPTNRRWRMLLGSFTGLCLLGISIGGFISSSALDWEIKTLPDLNKINTIKINNASTFYNNDNTIMAHRGFDKTDPVSEKEIPACVKNAFISTEDKTFWTNPGFDTFAIIRAGLWNFHNPHARAKGASTITQQLIKNNITGNEKTLKRKIDEVLLSKQLTEKWGKEKILSTYLNTVFLGHGYWGISAASHGYWGLPLDSLNISQCATLAGIPKAPETYDPIKNPEKSKSRRNIILDQMVHNGFISQEQSNLAKQEPIIQNTSEKKPQQTWALQTALEEANIDMREEGGEQFVSTSGLDIKTTFDKNLQDNATISLQKSLQDLDRSYNGWHGTLQTHVNHIPNEKECLDKNQQKPPETWTCAVYTSANEVIDSTKATHTLSQRGSRGDMIWIENDNKNYKAVQIPLIQSSLISMNAHTGAILANVGGWGYRPGDFNRATQAMRQPGSSFKPFLVLSAMEKSIEPRSLFLDGDFISTDQWGNTWSPKDYEKTTQGMVSLHLALRESLNIPMVRLLENIGVQRLQEISTQSFAAPNINPNLASALGVNETTPLRLAAGYAMIANGGMGVYPHSIESISQSGKILYKAKTQNKRISTPEATYKTTTILKDVLKHGTGFGLTEGLENKEFYAAKTGTSQNQKDAWFVAYTPDIITVVWTGYDQPKNIGHGATGAHVSGYIWKNYAKFLPAPKSDFTKPETIELENWSLQNGESCSKPSKDCVTDAFDNNTGPKYNTEQSFFDPNPQTTPKSAMNLANQKSDTENSNDENNEENNETQEESNQDQTKTKEETEQKGTIIEDSEKLYGNSRNDITPPQKDEEDYKNLQKTLNTNTKDQTWSQGQIQTQQNGRETGY